MNASHLGGKKINTQDVKTSLQVLQETRKIKFRYKNCIKLLQMHNSSQDLAWISGLMRPNLVDF